MPGIHFDRLRAEVTFVGCSAAGLRTRASSRGSGTAAVVFLRAGNIAEHPPGRSGATWTGAATAAIVVRVMVTSSNSDPPSPACRCRRQRLTSAVNPMGH